MSEAYARAFRQAQTDPDAFWGEAARAIDWTTAPQATYAEGPGWFPGGTLNPTPTVAVDLSKSASFPIIVNNYLLQGSVVVPISDYFLRINQGYTAASHAQEAARVDVVTARAKSHAEGRLAFYNWVRARGAVVVALQALADQKVHLQDAQNQFQVGNASKADVLRAETGVAAAELGVERAKSFAELTEKQVRNALTGEARLGRSSKDDYGLVQVEAVGRPVAKSPASVGRRDWSPIRFVASSWQLGVSFRSVSFVKL